MLFSWLIQKLKSETGTYWYWYLHLYFLVIYIKHLRLFACTHMYACMHTHTRAGLWALAILVLQWPCGEPGSAIWEPALREEGLPLFSQLPVTSAHQGSRRSRNPASAVEKNQFTHVSNVLFSNNRLCLTVWVFLFFHPWEDQLENILDTPHFLKGLVQD